MNMKKTVKKIVALGTGVGMVGATLMGAFAVDLADYPGNMLTGGSFDGKLVIGANAAPQDLIGAIDIAASLQAASVTEVAVGSGATSTTVIEGDAVQITDSADILEIGEQLGSVIETLTDDDLAMLQGGRVTTSKGSTEFTQVLELDVANAGSSLVKMDERDSDEQTGVYLFFDDGSPLFNYELEFTSGLESDVDSNDDAEDLEDETLFMLGQYYSIVDTDVDDLAADDQFILELIAGDVVDTLSEGETKTYTVDGTDYEITVLVIGEDSNANNQVKFLVNGEVTDALTDGDTDTLSDGLEIGVREIIETTAYRESDPGSIVEFYLGANKIEFDDGDSSNSALDGNVEINRENIEDASVDLKAVITAGEVRLNSIVYQLSIDADSSTDIFVGEGEGVAQFMDEPVGMLNDEWDFVFAGLTDPGSAEISFDPNGDDEYELTFTNRRGDTFNVPYAEATAADTMVFGDANDDFIFWEKNSTLGTDVMDDSETFLIGDDDYFLVTDDDADNDGDSYVLQWNDIDTDDQTLTFENVASGEDLEVTYSVVHTAAADSLPAAALISTNKSGDITIGGNDFDFWLRNVSSTFTLGIDADNDNSLGAGVNNTDHFVNAVVKGGGVLTLSNQTGTANGGGSGEWFATLSSLAEDVDNDVNHAVNISFSTDSSAELDVDIPSESSTGDFDGVWYNQDVDGEDRELGLTGYGALFDITDETNEADTLVIDYPFAQKEALVYVVGGDVQSSTVTSGGSTAQRVNVLPVGIAVLDTEVRYDGENMIVVGGPCANTMAAELLNSGADCAEGFSPGMGMIRIFDTGNNVAILVAGYSARDTVETAYVLAQHGDFASDLVGEEVEVVVAGANDVTVRMATHDDDAMMEEESMEDES